MSYKSLSDKEKKEFLDYRGKMNVGCHSMIKQILHWHYCARCGLLALNNDVTRKALKKLCIVYE